MRRRAAADGLVDAADIDPCPRGWALATDLDAAQDPRGAGPGWLASIPAPGAPCLLAGLADREDALRDWTHRGGRLAEGREWQRRRDRALALGEAPPPAPRWLGERSAEVWANALRVAGGDERLAARLLDQAIRTLVRLARPPGPEPLAQTA